ncbi:endoglucanase 3, partial [Tanacetum coccineum]
LAIFFVLFKDMVMALKYVANGGRLYISGQPNEAVIYGRIGRKVPKRNSSQKNISHNHLAVMEVSNHTNGAIVGGPNNNDFYPDECKDYIHSEPTTYTNAI